MYLEDNAGANELLKRLNNNLKESQDQLEFTLEAADIATWDLNILTGKFSGNARIKVWFGLNAEEEIPLDKATDIIAAEDRPRVLAAIARAMDFASGGNYNTEYAIINPLHPEPRYVRAKGKALFNEMRQPIRFSGILQDITEEKITLDVINENRNRLVHAYEQIRLSNKAAELGMFDMDIERGTLEWDERCRVLFGISHKDTVSYEKDFVTGLHPEDRERVTAIIDKLFVKTISNGDYDVEYRTVGAENGFIRWVRAKGKVIFNRRDEPVRFIGSVLDITGQVESRLKLQKAEQMLRFAIEASNIGTYIIDSKTRTLIASPRLKELFGFYPDEEMPYDAAIAQITEEFRSEVIDQVEATFKKEGDFLSEYKIKGFRDEKIRWVRAVGKVGKNGTEEGLYFAGAIIDITEQKQDDTRKNDFIGMVSHELKTPLTSLSVILQVLNTKLKNDEDKFIPAALDKAGAQVKKMIGMINGFLNVSRLESGKIQIDKRTFNLRDLVEEVVREIELTVSGHPIHFQLPEAINVDADYEKIGSVINNLVSNAVKYSAKGKKINVDCKMMHNKVQVSVKDEGIGIKPADREKLFDRYYRVESNNTANIAGFGIGLYLSAEIIHRHDGEIWVESDGVSGSVFHFTLPLHV